ncbi:hypothetical protein BEWA_051870 [Theileria equi strain WA]|uniref:CPW-WPC domain-containing protein n=1 Tax=Theileria equi strain WA TaxID=1537102 RepID=L1LD81_THEEQ|nr:hypothetical protein BEWA_051870 [Theileria equi strain WA]EKX73133.1 hypothetical protein BEWA_051870 [Theileria equi strain WA]|eukprot:XP_004832585.1 hypothetical protein BEWA_051870 [Theileria equi strain WA]
MYLGVLLYTLVYSVSCAVSDTDDQFLVEIPNIHSTQEIYGSFVNEPKPKNLTEVGGKLLTAAVKNHKNQKTIDGKCAQDFSRNCPGMMCEIDKYCKAPESYNGDCKTLVSFETLTPEEKINWSTSCNAPWPCKIDEEDPKFGCDDSKRNYLQPCPELFLKQKSETSGKYFCVPDPSTYTGPCDSFMDFTEFSRESKQLWAKSCGTNWPCFTKCLFVFEDCPMDWVKAEDGSCKSPSSYTGECEHTVFFTHYTQKMKVNHLVSCEIPFECSSECTRDYDACPVDWTIQGNGLCVSPSDVDPCTDVYKEIVALVENIPNAINIKKMTRDMKVLFESRCSTANWPCLTRDEYNWDLPCPQGWTVSKEGKCIPPELDDDDICKSSRVFIDEEEKRKFASHCRLNWPSIHEEKREIVKHESKVSKISGPIIYGTGNVYKTKNTNQGDELKEPKDVEYKSHVKRIKRKYKALDL